MPMASWGELEEVELAEGDGGEGALSGLEPFSTASSEGELDLFWESLVIFVIEMWVFVITFKIHNLNQIQSEQQSTQ